jgi:hypothetical protein
VSGSSTSWDRGINHYLYTPSTNDLRFHEDPNKWSVTGQQAAQYVRGHLIKSFQDDHSDVLNLHEASGSHPFMLMRSMMPYLESVSTLHEPGKNDVDRVVLFIKKYFSQSYYAVAREFYGIYRNGLMHRHFPKCDLIDVGGNLLLAGWEITAGRQKHPRTEQLKFVMEDTQNSRDGLLIPVCPRCFYDDLLLAMGTYADDLQKDNQLVNNFLKGFRSKS